MINGAKPMPVYWGYKKPVQLYIYLFNENGHIIQVTCMVVSQRGQIPAGAPFVCGLVAPTHMYIYIYIIICVYIYVCVSLSLSLYIYIQYIIYITIYI